MNAGPGLKPIIKVTGLAALALLVTEPDLLSHMNFRESAADE